VDYAQGFALGLPVPIDELVNEDGTLSRLNVSALATVLRDSVQPGVCGPGVGGHLMAELRGGQAVCPMQTLGLDSLRWDEKTGFWFFFPAGGGTTHGCAITAACASRKGGPTWISG